LPAKHPFFANGCCPFSREVLTMKYWMTILVAVIGLSIGCSEQKPPPSDVDTAIPDLEINEGDLVSPDEAGKAEPKTDAPAASSNSSDKSTAGDASKQGDAK